MTRIPIESVPASRCLGVAENPTAEPDGPWGG